MKGIGALYTEVGAKPIERYEISGVLIGENQPTMVSIMEFPDEAALDKVFKSEDYKTLLPYREKAFIKLEAFISKK